MRVSRKRCELRGAAGALGLEERPALVVHQTQLAADGRQAQVGVVLAQQQAMLGAAGEHAIGLARAARHQVVDEHADVAFAALRHEGSRFAGAARAALMPAISPWAAASS